jgi:hypothetical protein
MAGEQIVTWPLSELPNHRFNSCLKSVISIAILSLCSVIFFLFYNIKLSYMLLFCFLVNLKLFSFISGTMRYRPVGSSVPSSMYNGSAAMGSYLQQAGQFPYPYYYGYRLILSFGRTISEIKFSIHIYLTVSFINIIYLMSCAFY